MNKTLSISLALASFLSANSLEQIKSSNVIRIGVEPNNPPLSQIDRSGNFHGFEVELARKIKNYKEDYTEAIDRALEKYNLENNIKLHMDIFEEALTK